MRKITSVISIIILTAIAASRAFAAYPEETDDNPFSVYYLGLGISGSAFPSSSSAWKNISFSIDPNDHVIGGSFDGMESAVRASLTTNIDRKSRFLMPISYEYLFLRAGEVLYYNLTPELNYYGNFLHRIDVQKFSIGLDWQFWQTPFKDVNIYLGVDFKGLYIFNQNFSREDVRIEGDNVVSKDKFPYNAKENALRFGTEGKFGFRGHIINKLYINAFVGYEYFNLIGRNDKRGQLLTPFARTETKEDLINAWHYYLSIEYKL